MSLTTPDYICVNSKLFEESLTKQNIESHDNLRMKKFLCNSDLKNKTH